MEDKKSDVLPLASQDDDGNKVVTVKLVPQDGQDALDIRAKRKTKVQRLIDAYASQKGIQSAALKLLNDQGQRIQPNLTLAEAGIEEGDQLDVMMSQEGGFSIL
eukprot:TRINITY_DN2644_c0_g4_i2.p1 TRINITY_DN2644_c0_g4~~TRINITY_DN2644_c0_g4_i2.p1  ORF type:complete len:104 (+),score=31.73 TRINITY_DN2644_c0_g4_i2:59-370(+)